MRIHGVEPSENSLPYSGIYHQNTDIIFQSFSEYERWYFDDKGRSSGRWIGIISHRSSYLSGNTLVEQTLAEHLEARGLNVIMIYSYASTEANNDAKNFEQIIDAYFKNGNKIILEGFIHLQMLAATKSNNAGDVYEQVVDAFHSLGVPVFRPLIGHKTTKEEWEKSDIGLPREVPWAYTSPERVGMIEPILIGFRGRNGKNEPLASRIDYFTKRLDKLTQLRRTDNQEKKIVIMIHNAPCASVEGTIGTAMGLNVMESVILLMKELEHQDYKIDGVIPESGKALRDLIMEKKAYHDFRWTSVEDIIDCGGVLYQMPLREYMGHYNKFSDYVRNEMEGVWGPPPGEGMVSGDSTIITGLDFGNIKIMVQPKRGCYGAKCTGEVCKILHDPKCPPPHTFIGAYKYIEDTFKANAVIHVGTGGSLEYLPGKSNALSDDCFPQIALGTLSNFYIYNVCVGTEAAVSKRRTNAIIISHLPSAFTGDRNLASLLKLIGDYEDAYNLSSESHLYLENKIKGIIEYDDILYEYFDETADFIFEVKKLRGLITQWLRNAKNETMHIFGELPKLNDLDAYLDECISRPKDHLGDKTLLRDLLSKTDNEMKALIKCLGGHYLEPGLSGTLKVDWERMLPTGKNTYLLDAKRVPTQEAFEVGKKLAQMTIDRYKEEEGTFPKKIAMNMISTDITGSKGEQLSQILYLMGVQPHWDKSGHVKGVKLISLEELGRPRIDVMVRISGVLRDTYPSVIYLIDESVELLCGLEEEPEMNPLCENVRVSFNDLMKDEEIFDKGEADALSKIRVYGDKPGAYGAGVDLALKASAWESEEDLAKVFVQFSAFGYSKVNHGKWDGRTFIKQVEDTELTLEKNNSKRYDLLTCGFSASVHGGFDVLKKAKTGKSMKQYHGKVIDGSVDLASMVERIVENLDATVRNPYWKKHIMSRGYEGASEIMRKLQTIYDWQCTSEHIGDDILDDIVDSYINDPKTFEWFKENNQYAIEELTRRFLELYHRGKWNPEGKLLDILKKRYLSIEGDMEDKMNDGRGERQGNEIEILTTRDVESWNVKQKSLDGLF